MKPLFYKPHHSDITTEHEALCSYIISFKSHKKLWNIIILVHFISEESEIERISVFCLQLFTHIVSKKKLASNLGVFSLPGYLFNICFVSGFIFVKYSWGKWFLEFIIICFCEFISFNQHVICLKSRDIF